jgi:CheY-like chemotaxis protein
VPQVQVSQLNGRRILVVEDEWLLAEQWREELTGLGAVVLGPVSSVGEALELLERERPADIAILDVRLGDEAVTPIAQALRQRGIPFIFASGGAWWELPREFAEEIYYEKPIDLPSMLKVLSSL